MLGKHELIAIKDGSNGHVVAQTFTANLSADAPAFVAKNNRQGVSVYYGVNLLQPTATRRCKDTVAYITCAHADVDAKRLNESLDEIKARLLNTLPPQWEVRFSGGGFHVLVWFKEPVGVGTDEARRVGEFRNWLTDTLCADPLPNHDAALLRTPGSVNYKYGDARECVVLRAGVPVDLTEVEEVAADLVRPLFSVKEAHAKTATRRDYRDVLADMPTTGEGVDAAGYNVMRDLVLQGGLTPDAAVDCWINAVMDMAEREHLTDERGQPWTRKTEESAARARMDSTLKWLQQEHWKSVDAGRIAADTPPDWLWPAVDQPWVQSCARGGRPQIWRNRYGWCVRTPKEQPGTETVKPVTGLRVVSSGDFVREYTPLDPLLDGVLQMSFLYSLTGKTGDGKTTVVLLLAACIADERLFAGRHCERGPVFILAGENPDDVRMRWIGLCHSFGVDPDSLDVHFIPGVFAFPQLKAAIRKKAEELGRNPVLIIIDTSAAFFTGQDENQNTQLGAHARSMRGNFISLPGRPCVVVTCHPTKNPDMDNLLPRGGGAFLAEVDGNLVAIKDGDVITVDTHGKFRGPDFEPMLFRLKEVGAPRLKDKKGREVRTVIAESLNEDQQDSHRLLTREENVKVLVLLAEEPISSLSKIAERAQWTDPRTGEAMKWKARVVVRRLQARKMVRNDAGEWSITEAGRKALDRHNSGGKR
jgi:hypothetical protein